jgi:hypothetical protein
MSDIIARGIANSIGKIPNTKTWTAIEGQTVFTLSNSSYVPNKNLIEVIVESVPQISGDHYTETNSTSFTLNEPLSAGMKVYAKWYESKVPEIIGYSTRYVSTPTTATSSGAQGDWSSDGTYLYVCYATNSWRRVAISTW